MANRRFCLSAATEPRKRRGLHLQLQARYRSHTNRHSHWHRHGTLMASVRGPNVAALAKIRVLFVRIPVRCCHRKCMQDRHKVASSKRQGPRTSPRLMQDTVPQDITPWTVVHRCPVALFLLFVLAVSTAGGTGGARQHEWPNSVCGMRTCPVMYLSPGSCLCPSISPVMAVTRTQWPAHFPPLIMCGASLSSARALTTATAFVCDLFAAQARADHMCVT